VPRIETFLRKLIEEGGSDLHLSSGAQPIIRLHGKLEPVGREPMVPAELDELLREIAPEDKLREFEASGDVDFGYEIKGLGRFRVNYFRQMRGMSAAFRVVPERVPSMDELRLPAILKDLAMLPKGLVLVTGPTGSGKSTTLAAMIDHANQHRREHIITIEDPVEFVHRNKGCLVQQREVGRDTRSFQAALRGALREDPDIILVGEMRDRETIALALEAAETGHLVLSTLHTVSASKTVDRIIEVFPGDMQGQIRSSLSESLRAVVSQVLFTRADKPGRVAAQELLLAVPAVRNLIRENKTYQLPSLIQMGKAQGMQHLDEQIQKLLDSGMISPEDALAQAVDKKRFARHGNGRLMGSMFAE
jgi:twitching motility protein PilT